MDIDTKIHGVERLQALMRLLNMYDTTASHEVAVVAKTVCSVQQLIEQNVLKTPVPIVVDLFQRVLMDVPKSMKLARF